jgi:predicted RNase H-like HicB family nuclease
VRAWAILFMILIAVMFTALGTAIASVLSDFQGFQLVTNFLGSFMGGLQQRCRSYNIRVHLSIEIDREDDGRWIGEALELPGVITYGETREEAISNTERLAIEVIADRVRHAELPPSALNVSFRVMSEQMVGD